MATDKHYNEPGGVPPALEDHKPNDMPATRWMFYIIGVALAVFLVALIVNHYREAGPGDSGAAPVTGTEQAR